MKKVATIDENFDRLKKEMNFGSNEDIVITFKEYEEKNAMLSQEVSEINAEVSISKFIVN